MPKLRTVSPLLILIWSLAAAALSAQEWPQFRGPHASGIGEGGFPVHFGPNSNVVWKTALPPGHSSPCIWKDKIFLNAFEGSLLTLCLDRASGRELWRGAEAPGRIEKSAALSHPATSTPCTDGNLVFAYFGAFGLICYDSAGQERWKKPLPVPVTQHGAGTSPVISGDRLVLGCDQDLGSYLLCVRKSDGATIWKTDRPEFRRGFGTPLLWPAEKPSQVIVGGSLKLTAYDLETGAEVWSVRGFPNEMVSSPISGEGLIFAAGWTPGASGRMPPFDTLLEGDADKDGKLSRSEIPGGPARQQFLYIDANKDGLATREEYESIARIFEESRNTAMGIRPGGKGDVTDTHVSWRFTRGLPYVPSPLYYDGRLYLVKNGGLATCLNARTGEPFYQEERLGALGDYYSSPVAADGKICAASQSGSVVIFAAGPKLEVLARNSLEEPIIATPAIADGKLYIRTRTQLYAFGKAN